MNRARFPGFTADQPFKRWLNEGKPASGRWLSKPCIIAAWAGLLLALVTPPRGTGFTVCWIASATGIPCPGCGLTRSLSCGLRGMFAESWHYHPMGLLVLALFVTIAVTSLCRGLRYSLISLIESRARFCNGLYLCFVVIFVVFGLVRALVTIGHSLL